MDLLTFLRIPFDEQRGIAGQVCLRHIESVLELSGHHNNDD